MRPLPFAPRTDVGPFGVLLVTLVATLLLAPVFKDARLVGHHMAQRGRDLDL